MIIKLKRDEFSKALSKIKLGLGNLRIFPVTSAIRLFRNDNKFTIVSTDMDTFIEVSIDAEFSDSGDLDIIVAADQITKLVDKTTVDFISIHVEEDLVKIRGNGTYKIPLLDLTYPVYNDNPGECVVYMIPLSEIQDALKVSKCSVGSSSLMPFLSGYYVGSNKVVTTDGTKMCIVYKHLVDEPILLSQKVVDLIGNFSSSEYINDNGEIILSKYESHILVSGNNVNIYTSELADKDKYPDISSIINLEYSGECKLVASDLIDSLNRISIFVDPFENVGVYMLFDESGLFMRDFKGHSSEFIECDIKGELGFKVFVNPKFLLDLLNVVKSSELTIKYGNENAVQIESDGVIQIVSQMEYEGDDAIEFKKSGEVN